MEASPLLTEAQPSRRTTASRAVLVGAIALLGLVAGALQPPIRAAGAVITGGLVVRRHEVHRGNHTNHSSVHDDAMDDPPYTPQDSEPSLSPTPFPR